MPGARSTCWRFPRSCSRGHSVCRGSAGDATIGGTGSAISPTDIKETAGADRIIEPSSGGAAARGSSITGNAYTYDDARAATGSTNATGTRG